MAEPSSLSWHRRLAGELATDLRLIAILAAVLLLCRAALIASLWSYAGPQADALGVVTALARGVPFDLRVATVLLLPTVAFSLSAAGRAWPAARRRLRTGLLAVLLPACALLTVVDHYYFREYAAQFDHFVVGLIYDDTRAILSTVARQYPLGWIALGLLVLTTLTTVTGRRIARWAPPPTPRSPWANGYLILGLVAIIVCCARGSVSRLPAQSKNVAVTRDEKLLNRLVLNPLASLDQAIGDWRENHDTATHAEPPMMAAALQRLAPGAADLDQAMERRAAGAVKPPRHIVLLIMESQSAWPLAAPWDRLGMCPELASLGRRGLACPRFLSEGWGTIYSVGPLLSGLPGSDVVLSYQDSARHPYPSSIAPIMRRLGYRTRFFYSGYLSWQRLGAFVEGQGFEEIHGGGSISDWTDGSEWGVDDERLLGYVARQQHDATATFDVVLTTSNHPPYTVPVAARGFPITRWPADLGSVDGEDLRILGHLWYADRCLGAFVRQVESAQPDTLFVITGDHYGRRFPTTSPNPWERCAVPGILYGRPLAGLAMRAEAGSHLDLLPTIIERCAPAGFAYHAIGVDLLTTPQTVAVTSVGGFSRDGAAAWNDTSDAVNADLAAWQSLRDDRTLFGWWRVLRGPTVTAARSTPAP